MLFTIRKTFNIKSVCFDIFQLKKNLYEIQVYHITYDIIMISL